MTNSFISILFFIFIFLVVIESRKINIQNKKLEERSWYIVERYGFYKKDESPASHAPGNGHVYWNLDVNLTSSSIDEEDEDIMIYLLYTHSDGLDYYGEGYGEDLCCTKELVNKGKCNSTNEVYENSNVPDGISILQVLYPKINKTLHVIMDESPPFKSGIHYVFIINCLPDTQFVINGNSKTLNTYGYLSSELYPFLPFYGSLAALYLVVVLVWVYLLYKFWNQILKLQIYLSCVIGLSMIETATWYFFYLHYNNTGHAHFGSVVLGILVSSLKRTISRVLVLVVSMGYGVVKPTLGSTSTKIATIGVLYFIFSGILNVLELKPEFEASDIGIAVTLFLVVPVACMDTAFYWWIFVSLLQTLSRLKSRKQGAKYLMYLDFLGVLVASAVLSAIVVVFQLAYVMGNADDWWRVYWLGGAGYSTALPVVVYLVILMAMSWIWRPVENNTRYAYSELLDDGGDENDFSMQILSAVSLRPSRKEPTHHREERDEQSEDPEDVLDLSLGALESHDNRASKLE